MVDFLAQLEKTTRRCKDCLAEGRPLTRPAPHPGPRCTTHHRAFRKAAKARAHDGRVVRVYGLAPGEYERLYEAQGGRCYGCQRATGRAKKLAVDHNHRCAAGHPPEVIDRCCVRGLLCGPCNKIIGMFRDDPEALIRLGLYLINPPARGILGGTVYT